jgi:hypothetical protein
LKLEILVTTKTGSERANLRKCKVEKLREGGYEWDGRQVL